MLGFASCSMASRASAAITRSAIVSAILNAVGLSVPRVDRRTVLPGCYSAGNIVRQSCCIETTVQPAGPAASRAWSSRPTGVARS